MKNKSKQPEAKFNKPGNFYEHKNCGGSIMYDAMHYEEKPFDLVIAGTPEGAVIMVKKLVIKSVKGGCLKCHHEGLFRLSSKVKINSRTKKLKRA